MQSPFSLPPNPTYDPNFPAISVSRYGDFLCNVPHAFPLNLPLNIPSDVPLDIGLPNETVSLNSSPQRQVVGHREKSTKPLSIDDLLPQVCNYEVPHDPADYEKDDVCPTVSDAELSQRLHEEHDKLRKSQRMNDLSKLYRGNRELVKCLMNIKHPEHCPYCLSGKGCKYYAYIKKHGSD